VRTAAERAGSLWRRRARAEPDADTPLPSREGPALRERGGRSPGSRRLALSLPGRCCFPVAGRGRRVPRSVPGRRDALRRASYSGGAAPDSHRLPNGPSRDMVPEGSPRRPIPQGPPLRQGNQLFSRCHDPPRWNVLLLFAATARILAAFHVLYGGRGRAEIRRSWARSPHTRRTRPPIRASPLHRSTRSPHAPTSPPRGGRHLNPGPDTPPQPCLRTPPQEIRS
jgi:hypothetical protein